MKVKLYPYYTHRVDPVMENLCAVIRRRNGTRKSIASKAGCSVNTLHAWEKRKTRRPQFATIAAVARSLGDEGIVAVVNTIRRGR